MLNAQTCCFPWLPTACNDGVMFMPKSLCKSAYSPRCHARIIADQSCRSHLLKSHLTRERTPIGKYEQISLSKVHHYLIIDIKNICKGLPLSISKKRHFESVFPRTAQHRKWLSSSFIWYICFLKVSSRLNWKFIWGLTQLTKAPLWSAPIQRLIKAASNEGSLIDTAGLASPLAGINDGSHMMRLMTGRQCQTTTTPHCGTILRLCHAARLSEFWFLGVSRMFPRSENIYSISRFYSSINSEIIRFQIEISV